MKLLYFDHDHGTETLLQIDFDRPNLMVTFEYDRGPDPTHDELADDVEPIQVRGETRCASFAEFDGFSRALLDLMRTTAFSVQDPTQRPFAAMPHERVSLRELGDGLALEEVAARVPHQIVAEAGFRPELSERAEGLRGLLGPG